MHTPREQPWPLPQTLPHPPQFDESDEGSMQRRAHAINPTAQVAAQLPLLHTCDGAQIMLQPPQLPGSVLGLVHESPHSRPLHESTGSGSGPLRPQPAIPVAATAATAPAQAPMAPMTATKLLYRVFMDDRAIIHRPGPVMSSGRSANALVDSARRPAQHRARPPLRRRDHSRPPTTETAILWRRTMGYIFDPHELHEVAKHAVGQPFDTMVRSIIDELAARYPGYINTDVDWIYNITAGATGVMTVLHASLSEYVILFGTPVGTEGFSGRYLVEIWDSVLSGEMWTYTTDTLSAKTVHKAGEHAVLRRDQVKGFRLHDETWLLEYGRGAIPTALPLALGDSVFSSMDFYTVAKTLWVYGGLTAKNLLRGKV
jgi:C-8 sterol isomerase